MFGSHEKEEESMPEVTQQQTEDTIIGKTIKIEGDLVSNGDIIVEGEVVGSLKTEKTLRVGPGAKVSADIKATVAFVSGEVTGNMEIGDKVELTEGAVVNGDIKTKVVSIHAGAKFNGRCTMEDGVAINVVAEKTIEKTKNNENDETSEDD